MSLDCIRCERCNAIIHIDEANSVFINKTETRLCDSCVNEMLNSEQLFLFSEEDEVYGEYSESTKDKIADCLGSYYVLTVIGFEMEIKRLEEIAYELDRQIIGFKKMAKEYI